MTDTPTGAGGTDTTSSSGGGAEGNGGGYLSRGWALGRFVGSGALGFTGNVARFTANTFYDLGTSALQRTGVLSTREVPELPVRSVVADVPVATAVKVPVTLEAVRVETSQETDQSGGEGGSVVTLPAPERPAGWIDRHRERRLRRQESGEPQPPASESCLAVIISLVCLAIVGFLVWALVASAVIEPKVDRLGARTMLVWYSIVMLVEALWLCGMLSEGTTKLKSQEAEAMGGCFGMFFIGALVYGFILLGMIPEVADPAQCDPELLKLFLAITITGNVLNAGVLVLIVVYAVLAIAFIIWFQTCMTDCCESNCNCPCNQ